MTGRREDGFKVSPVKSFQSQTYSGLLMNLSDPDPASMSIIDVAHHTARICRYGGAIKTDWYSVAEHSYHLAKYVLDNWLALGLEEHGGREERMVTMAYEALMHDVGETWYGDWRAPLKASFPEFKAAARLVDQVAADKWGFSVPTPTLVDELDKRIVTDEKTALLLPLSGDRPWRATKEALGITIYGWVPAVAEAKWLELYAKLTPKKLPDQGEYHAE